MPEDLPIRYQLRKFAGVYRAFTQLVQKLRPPGPQELAMPDFQMEVTVPPQLADAAYTVENQSNGFRRCSRFLAHFYSRAYPGGTTGPPCRTFRERFIPRTLALITNPLAKGGEG